MLVALFTATYVVAVLIAWYFFRKVGTMVVSLTLGYGIYWKFWPVIHAQFLAERSQQALLRLYLILWVVGSITIAPLAWVFLVPDGVLAMVAFLGFLYYEKAETYWRLRVPDWKRSKQRLAAAATVAAAALTTWLGLFLLLTPVCNWLAYAETVELQWLNRDLIYGFTLCYPAATVDYFSITMLVVFNYFLINGLLLVLVFLPLAAVKWIANGFRRLKR